MKTLKIVGCLVGAVVLAACEPDVASKTQSADTTCGRDQILWTFDDTASSSSSAWSQSMPDASTPVAKRNVITSVEVASCVILGADGGVEESRGNNSIVATQACRDMTMCQLPFTCVSDVERALNSPAVKKPWKIQAEHTCSDGRRFGWTRQADGFADFYCPQPAAVAPARPARQACIPRTCNGSQRRDENMNCVTDLTRLVIREDKVRLLPMSLTGRFLPFDVKTVNGTQVHAKTNRPLVDAILQKRLIQGQLYRFTGGVQYLGIQPPKHVRASLWLSEVHDGVDGGTAAASQAPSESFRCLVKVFDVGVSTPDGGAVGSGSLQTVSLDENIVVPADCFNTALAYQNQYPWLRLDRSFTALPVKPVRELRFHMSYDLDDTTHFVPKGKTQSEACSVDPMELFYSSNAEKYDQLAYYKQREIAPTDYFNESLGTFDPPVRRSSYQAFFINPDGPGTSYPQTRVEMGLSDVRVDKPEVTIRVNSNATASFLMSSDWYLAMDGLDAYPLYLAQHFKPKLQVFLVPKTATGIEEPTAAEGYVSIGAINLPSEGGDGKLGVGPLGVTGNGRFIVDSALKSKFLSPGSQLYVPDGQRTFEVLGCLTGKSGDFSITPEYWRDDVNYDLYGGFTVGNDRDAAAAYRPPGAPNPGRGCRWSKTPVVVTIDRSFTAVQPIDDVLWQGQSNTQAGGNGSVQQTNDNDVDRTCQPTDGGTERCEQGSGAGQKGEGDYGKSYYETSTSSVYAPGSLRMTNGQPDDDSESAGGAEVLGYQVLDPEADEDMEQWMADPINKKQKVSLTITPPWDAIWTAIQEANEGNANPEWKVGRYAGLMGLGVGWGYKQPVGSFGIVTFTVSVGFSLALVTSVSHSTEPDGDYKCVKPALADGGVPLPCIQVGDEERGFKEANVDCQTRGARLAELSSLDESAVLQTLLNGADSPGEALWVGAQQADEFKPALCAFTWIPGYCSAEHKTGYRWLSNDETFASAVGSSSGTIDGSKIFFSGGVRSGLIPRAPARAGVLFNGDGSISSEPVGNAHPYACLYDAARSDVAITLSAAIELGFGVGVGVEWCWPNDELGICLAGSLNLVAMKVAPTVETTFHHLKDHRGRSARRDNTNLFAEWGITLLEGAIELKVKALIFEFSVTLLEFSGFKIDGGKLYDFNFPSMERFQ